MLVSDDGLDTIDELWESASIKTVLPDLEHEFFTCNGLAPSKFDSRRSYHRFFLRIRAVLERDGKWMGIYTCDVAKQGVGFLSPKQLLPLERFRLWLPGSKTKILQVVRCRRIAEQCYECGSLILSADDKSKPVEWTLDSAS